MESQEIRVLKHLQSNPGWTSGQFFLHDMMLSQYHRAIWNLQKKRDKYVYDGIIEASDFTDQYNFKSYRLTKSAQITDVVKKINATDPFKRALYKPELENIGQSAMI